MENSDLILEESVREWVLSKPAAVEVVSASRGGSPAFLVKPSKAAAITFRLWVSDSGKHVACSFGGGVWWDQAVSLRREEIFQLLNAIALASAGEEVQRLWGKVIGRRGFIQLPSRRLVHTNGICIPGLKWAAEEYESYE